MHAARPSPPEWNLQRLLHALLTHAPLILGAALLLALAAYTTLARRPPVYEAVSSVLAAQSDSADPIFTTAAALPEGAVEQALHSQALVQDIVAGLRRSGLKATTIERVSGDLKAELGVQDFSRIRVRSELNDRQGGTYVISARGRSPQEARVLADTAVAALLAWDHDRAVQAVTRLQGSLRNYLASVDRRLAATADPGQRQVLIQARQSAADRLFQLEQVQEAASGTLSLLSAAVTPARPISPSPLGRTVLVFVLATLAGTVLAALRSPAAGRRGSLPELGWLPPLSPDELATADSPWSAPLHRAVTLLRLNLLARPLPPGKRLVVSAPRPTPELSAVTARLARALAESGQRVLLIDANLPGAAQRRLWHPTETSWQRLPGAAPQARRAPTLAAALAFPEGAQGQNVAPGLDLLPSADSHDPDFSLQGVARLDELLTRWAEDYDVVVIDAPPLSLSNDALTLCGGRDSLLLVADGTRDWPEPGPVAGVLGVVWNNVPQTWPEARTARRRDQPTPGRAAGESEAL